MTKRAALNVSLTPGLVAFVEAQVASGRYASASEVVRAALRGLERDAATGQLKADLVPALAGRAT
jgi:antitoxin ParD1/3/4